MFFFKIVLFFLLRIKIKFSLEKVFICIFVYNVVMIINFMCFKFFLDYFNIIKIWVGLILIVLKKDWKFVDFLVVYCVLFYIVLIMIVFKMLGNKLIYNYENIL